MVLIACPGRLVHSEGSACAGSGRTGARSPAADELRPTPVRPGRRRSVGAASKSPTVCDHGCRRGRRWRLNRPVLRSQECLHIVRHAEAGSAIVGGEAGPRCRRSSRQLDRIASIRRAVDRFWPRWRCRPRVAGAGIGRSGCCHLDACIHLRRDVAAAVASSWRSRSILRSALSMKALAAEARVHAQSPAPGRPCRSPTPARQPARPG